jgi:hypothetical protein
MTTRDFLAARTSKIMHRPSPRRRLTQSVSGTTDASRKPRFQVLCSTWDWDAHCVRILGSFLWADRTRGALQVFLQQQFPAVENSGAVVGQEGIKEGVWITVDPIPGCIVCNVGESQWVIVHAELQRLIAMCDSVGGLDEWHLQEHNSPRNTPRVKLSVSLIEFYAHPTPSNTSF